MITIRKILIPAALVVAAWTLVAAISATAEYMAIQSEGRDIEWLSTFFSHLPMWYLWALLTPFVFWLARRYPFKADSWGKPLLVNFSTSIVWMAIYGVLMVIYFFAVWDIPESQHQFALRKILNYRFYIDYYVYWVIVAVAQAVEYYRRYLDQVRRSSLLQRREETLRRQLAESKLHYLRAQINPHFLFNTLNGVTGQIRKGDSQAAISLLTGLGDLLRHALDSEQELFVPLAEELKFTRRYLEIQQIRFPDSIQTNIDVEQKALEILVPGLILQPLIENAIKHGSATEGHTPEIEIGGNIRGRWLCVDIVNTIGPGSRDADISWMESADRDDRDGWGIGLTNTYQRLSIIYGDEYRFDLKLVSDDRVRARILVPAETRLDRLTWTKSES